MKHLHMANSEFSILSSEGHFHSEDLLSHLLDLAARLLPVHKPNFANVIRELEAEQEPGHERDWTQWYHEQMADSLNEETDRMKLMIERIISSLGQLTDNDIKDYCRERLITDSFIGSEAKRAILKKLAMEHKTSFKVADKDSAYDGYLDKAPIIIKHYESSQDDTLDEVTLASTVFYELHEDEIELMYEMSA